MIQDWEDPATGSAASALCCYLSLQLPSHETVTALEFTLIQGVEMGRNSEIGVKVERAGGKNCIDSVMLSGKAIKVMEGFLEID